MILIYILAFIGGAVVVATLVSLLVIGVARVAKELKILSEFEKDYDDDF